MAVVDLLFEDASVDPEDLHRVVVTRGPGSFTGIRAGLATAAGLAAATGAEVLAYDSLAVQAARAADGVRVWTAQPGRRGEVYAQPFETDADGPPVVSGPQRILAVSGLVDLGPWVAAETLDLGAACRADPVRSTAEALLHVVRHGMESGPVEPLYVEGPPVRRRPE